MNRPHATLGLVVALLAFPAGMAAAAQLYKWVDERGVVNYSNQPPADPRTARNVRGVEDRVSVYTPDPALTSAIATFRQHVNQAMYEAPAPTQPAVTMLGTSSPLPTEYESYVSGYYPYYWVAGGFRPRPRPLPGHPSIKPPHAEHTGTFVGMNRPIPGNASAVPGFGSPFMAPLPAFRGTNNFARDVRFR